MYFGSALLVIIVFQLVAPFITQRSLSGGYSEKLRAHVDAQNKRISGSDVDSFVRLAPLIVRRAIFSCAVLIGLAFVVGDGRAAREIVFYVNAANENEVVLRQYNARAVCCTLVDGKLQHQNYCVIEVPSEHRFVRKHIGRLEVPMMFDLMIWPRRNAGK
jgi:hypothetical protein